LPLSLLCPCCFGIADVADADADASADAVVVVNCMATAISFASRSKSSILLGAAWCRLNKVAAAAFAVDIVAVLRCESASEPAVSRGAKSVDAKSSNDV
jgi:hypothetical protein